MEPEQSTHTQSVQQPSLTLKPVPAHAANISFAVMILLAGLSSVITAYLVMFGRYLELGYKTNAEDVAYAGMQVWDLHHVFTVLTVVLFACALIALFWPKLFGKPLGLVKASASLFGLILLAVTFFPYPFEFQIRHYASASDGTYILLAQGSADFVDGNEGAFTGSLQEEKVESFYTKDGSTRNFNCITNDAWWWGKLAVTHHFYPILDDKNHLTLLETRCKEITHE